MPSAHLTLKEEEVTKLVLEFLSNRELSISQLALERESGIINGAYSNDMLFLRQLILDGQWDDVLSFIQPLETLESFDAHTFRYLVLKHKYIELLCIRSETGPVPNIENAVEEVVKCLGELEQYCPSKEDYNNLCLLLTLPRLSDHFDYKNWNPSNARMKCFKAICPIVEKFLPLDKKNQVPSSKGDRLIQLIIKGILYESSVEYCQQRATSSSQETHEMNFTNLLTTSGLNDSDLSLLSWLQSIPPETFSYPFEQKNLSVNLEQLQKPSLEASWSEQILVTPIKPKLFPHSATPFTRLRSADFMSRSLTPHFDAQNKNMMAFSMVDLSSMSRSFASFHLTGKKLMNTSVDKLFEGGDVFSTSFTDLQAILESPKDKQQPMLEQKSSPGSVKSDGPVTKPDAVPKSSSAHKGRKEDASHSHFSENSVSDTSNSDLWKEFQKQKQQIQGKIQEMNHLPQEPLGSGMHQSNLATSTPKQPSQSSRTTTPLPHSSPVLSQNGAMRGLTVDKTKASKIPPTHLDSSPLPSAHHSPGSSPVSSVYHLQKQHPPQQLPPSAQPGGLMRTPSIGPAKKPHFIPVTRLEDAQAIRTGEFHPSGQYYAIGSNSKTLRICAYPKLNDLREDHVVQQPTVLSKRLKHHKGSIYCLTWNPTGELLATGSNDKTVKLVKFNPDTYNLLDGSEAELTMHDGTVRDMCFIEDVSNRSSLLISGGAGDCKIYVTDCDTATPFQALSGHTGHILSLYTWGGAMFVSGSADGTVRFWDLRTRGCVNLISPPVTPPGTGSGPVAVASVCVDPSGRLLVSGHDDAACMLYDIRGGRIIQCFRPHAADIRFIRFSPKAYYLLTASYDCNIVLTDLQGDLTQPLPSLLVAQHADKVIQAHWHPRDFSFLSTSADKSATLWALPAL